MGVTITLSRRQLRSRRKREVRAVTVSMKRTTVAERERWRRENPVPDNHPGLPTTRGECQYGPRPCPMVGCRYNLYIDVSPKNGSIKTNFPDLEVWELTESCALDVADRHGTTLEDVGSIMNLTRERVRQIEAKALTKMQAEALREFTEPGLIRRRKFQDEVDDELDTEDEVDDECS